MKLEHIQSDSIIVLYIECPACKFRLVNEYSMHTHCTQCPHEFCSGCGNEYFKHSIVSEKEKRESKNCLTRDKEKIKVIYVDNNSLAQGRNESL